VIELHARIPAVADRWGYHLRTLEAGKLLDEPIPQVTFGPPDSRVGTFLHQWSRLVGRDCGGWDDFRTLLDWLCWALALGRDQQRLRDEVNEKLYRGVDLGPLLDAPYDYLGEHVAASKARGLEPHRLLPDPAPRRRVHGPDDHGRHRLRAARPPHPQRL
jgi:hypothetical protein